MGIILGLIGGGGSILTVPILVYCFGVPATLATGYSLIIVGASSAIGGWKYHGQALVNWRVVRWFSLPSVVGVIIARLVILPSIPATIGFGSLSFSNHQIVMIAFSILVVATAVFMFRGQSKPSESKLNSKPSYGLIVFDGLLVGIFTGFVGAGGGFMIVPALMLLLHLPLKRAIGTSLIIICIKSLMGGLTDILLGASFNYGLLMGVIAVTFFGVIIGTKINALVDPMLLKRGFAGFILVMGGLILIKEFFLAGGF